MIGFKMIVTLYLFSCFLVYTNALTEQEQWEHFKISFDKLYRNTLEERSRLSIFRENLATIEAHNKKFEAGEISHKMAVNKFADLTQAEFVSMLKYNSMKKNLNHTTEAFKAPLNTKIPTQIDWIESGAVTPIKDQGGCGSCWSFSATGALEGQYFIKNKKLISLSEQNLVDCSQDYGNYGCGGGLMDDAFAYVRDFGIMTEDSYPYDAMDEVCQFKPSESVLKIQGFVDIESGSESQLEVAVATVGPISVAVDASNFAFYSGGVLDDQYCGNGQFNLDHGILAVGYGTSEDGIDYWLVKNSWGASWGENGYIRMSRNKKNQCGIATAASYPIL